RLTMAVPAMRFKRRISGANPNLKSIAIVGEPQPRIFVSHSNNDNDFGVQLVKDLRRILADETAVWYDSQGGLLGGDAWWRKIMQELKASNVFIVVLSPSAMQSPWVNDEIDTAWRLKNSSANMRIIPVLYQTCEVRSDL